MLYGIDISNHQGGLSVAALGGVDFVICKATEGTGFVDPYCDSWVQECIALGKSWGFYHFARENDPCTEANFFVENTRNYFGVGIPVLDWETTQSVEWVNNFVCEVNMLTGVWPVIYGNPWRFNQGGVNENCGRWVASYPEHLINPAPDADPGEVPETDGLVCMWQFASDGRVSGWGGDLDVNQFFGDIHAWNAYAGIVETTPAPAPSVNVLENDRYKITIEDK